MGYLLFIGVCWVLFLLLPVPWWFVPLPVFWVLWRMHKVHGVP